MDLPIKFIYIERNDFNVTNLKIDGSYTEI